MRSYSGKREGWRWRDYRRFIGYGPIDHLTFWGDWMDADGDEARFGCTAGCGVEGAYEVGQKIDTYLGE